MIAETLRSPPFGISDWLDIKKETKWSPGVPMTVREILKILRKDGWYIDHYTGSHRQMRNPNKPGMVTVAGKPKDDINPKTLRSILRQAGLK